MYMSTLIGIIFIVVMIALFENTPGHVWIGVGIVLTCIAAFVAVWFGITYLLKASIKIVSEAKD